ncbi:MAG: L-ribulose-5-phosphate 4-epimerase [Ktedonobacteraceae bacterium]
MTNSSYSDLKEQLVLAAQRLIEAGVMSHSGHGNMSARLPATEHMLLTSVSHFTNLTSEKLVVVTFDGEVVEGSMDPTTREIVSMHACVYRARKEVNAVIHTHSPRVTSFALAHTPLPCVYEAFLRFGITEDVPVAQWAPRGSQESVDYIVQRLQQYPTVPAVLLANHGLLAFSRDPLSTAQLIIIMEESAQLTLDARAIGGVKPFPTDALERERKHMQQFGSV